MAVHFIGFRDDRYWSAAKVFGLPDFVHPAWDARAKFGGEVAPGDVFVFADGDETSPLAKFTHDDSQRF